MQNRRKAASLLLAGAMLVGAAPLTHAEDKEAEAVKIVEFTPGSPGEEAYLYHAGTAFQIQEGADGYFRISDLNDTFIYAFDGKPGDRAFVSLTISCQYTVEASADNETYTTVLTSKETGDTRERRGIDLTPYFEQSSRVYLRFSDTDPSDGWGTQLYKTKFVLADGDKVSGAAWEDISEGWTVSDGTAYAAGTALQAAAGEKVVFTRQVTLPAWWQETGIGFSFSGVESEAVPVFTIDGETVTPTIASGRTYMVKAPASCAGRTVTLQVETTATADGTAGLWKSVRMGCADLVAYPDAVRSFGDTTRKLTGNYAGCDFVTLNALAGNYATTLIDSRFNITGFDAGIAMRNQFFAHDTSRTLLALADEETYSPIVRLDAIRALYQGVKSAMVPGSDYEMFLKRDFSKKVVRQSRADSRKLEWWSVFDAVEVFTDMYVTTGERTLDEMTVTEMDTAGEDTRLDGYADGQGGKVEVLSKWYGGMEEEAVKRNTKQYLAPMKAQATPRGVYDLYPAFPVGENKIRSGIGCLADWIERHGQVVIDGYGGVFWDELVSELGDEFRRRGKCVRWFRTDVAMRDARTLEEMLAPDLGGEDPLFGRMTERQLRDWFDPGKLNAFRPDQEADINVLIGIGAALAGWKAPLIYVDVPKNEIQFRMRAGWVKNLGMNKPKNNQQTYKHFFFVDWVVLNRHKAECLPQIELIVDEQRRGQQLLMMSGEDLREGLHRMGRNFFRVRPWFEPGAWGGQWMKQHIPGLNEEVPNLAWSFELMVLENGLMFESNGYRLEVSFDFLMYNDYRQVLGESADVFKTDFPIRFDFLDTFDGGNLSVQCHPRTTYIREQFNMPFTQDETYYILDSRQNPQVYLGFQENIRPEEFGEVLKQSQAEGKTIDIEKYVQKFPAHKHDLFLIPNGTVHASGKNCMVLEISSAPYIFTFKMYDWL